MGRTTYRLEHLQTSDREALGASVHLAAVGALEAPRGAGARVEQHADEEQVDQAAALLRVVDGVEGRQQVRDAVAAAHAEVLVAAVAWDRVEGGIVVALYCVLF